MKALVYHGPGRKNWEDKPKPVVQQPTDAIVRMLKTTICGTDLHILKGDTPEVVDGRILGHEGVGVIEEAGGAVTNFKPGDHVLISCITACGRCEYCKRGMYSHCVNGGWILGHMIDGTQAEYVRIPYADTSLYAVPQGISEESLVMLSDILPTGYEAGVLNGQVKPGDSVVIVGAGPVGLSAMLTAQFYSPSKLIMLDIDDNRLAVAKQYGATDTVNSRDGAAAIQQVLALTGGKGADVAIEAVGTPVTFGLAEALVAPGGRLANIGVHGEPVTLHLERLWSQNIALTTRLVDTVTTPSLLNMVVAGKVDPQKLITHHFALGDILNAYDTFGNAARERALKVILSAE